MNTKKITAFICAVSMTGSGAFSGYSTEFSGVSSVTVSAETLSNEDFSYTVTEDGEVVINDYTGEAADAVIPSEIDGKKVTGIGKYAFYGCSSLTSVTIPEGVTSIGYEAFYRCSSLTSITIPEGVTSIGESAFYECSSLTSVTIPEGVTSIGYEAFYGTAWLENKRAEDPLVIINGMLIDGSTCEGNLIIPEGVTSIGDSAFRKCRSLTGITIPESVTSIGYCAFLLCSGLESIMIPESVTSIGDGAFFYCSSLTSITIPESVISIGGGAFFGTAWQENKSAEDPLVIINGILIDGRKCEGDVIIPEGVTEIGDCAFYGCSSITGITIPEGVTEIGHSVFSECSNLESITIPESVTSIGRNAFDNKLSAIYGYTGSEAESYAINNNINFVPIEEKTDVTEPSKPEDKTPAETVNSAEKTESEVFDEETVKIPDDAKISYDIPDQMGYISGKNSKVNYTFSISELSKGAEFDYAAFALDLPEGFTVDSAETDASPELKTRSLIRYVKPDSEECAALDKQAGKKSNGGYVVLSNVKSDTSLNNAEMFTVTLNVPENVKTGTSNITVSSMFGRYTEKTSEAEDGTVTPHVAFITNADGEKIFSSKKVKYTTGIRGDVNLDGTVNQLDATLILREILANDVRETTILPDEINMETAGEDSEKLALYLGDIDFSDNGTAVKQSDATCILRAILLADLTQEKVITDEIWEKATGE